MIYFYNLERYSIQEVFDYLSIKLLEQNEKCPNRYKKGNLYSPIGLLIPKSKYKKELEKFSYTYLINFLNFSSKYNLLINDIQNCHNFFSIEEWPKQLIKISKKFNLKSDKINEKGNQLLKFKKDV